MKAQAVAKTKAKLAQQQQERTDSKDRPEDCGQCLGSSDCKTLGPRLGSVDQMDSRTLTQPKAPRESSTGSLHKVKVKDKDKDRDKDNVGRDESV